MHAYDVRTGKLEWVFHSIPQTGEFGADTWPDGRAARPRGGVHNWSELTVDEARGIAYIPFGTARFDFYGGNRHGNNLFGNSLVALDARTGKRLWHYQLVHHDLWDYDLPQAPKLLTIRKNGRNVDVVAQATKHGFLFVFDRVTGTPIWPIEERPVPQSDVPGEQTSPTQPFPTMPPPFARQSFTEKDINPYPAAGGAGRRCASSCATSRNEGLFTPPSFQGTIEMPGHNGGANWGSSAVDPINGEMYVVVEEPAGDAARAWCSNEEPTRAQHRGGSVRHARTRPRRSSRRREGRGREGTGALRRAVRLPAQPDERHGRDRPAVVAPHRLRSEHRRDQVARARRQRRSDPACRRTRARISRAARRS